MSTEALSPYGESLAREIASCSESTRWTATTGPNVSAPKHTMSSVTPVSTVGAKKNGPMSGSG